MNGYELTRQWFDFRFENPSRCRSIHTELYLFIVDKWNRLGQRDEVGMPTSFTMEALGIGSYKTYSQALQDLIEFGFIKEIRISTNQHQSRIVALVKFAKATTKALSKATAIADAEPTTNPSAEPTTTIIEYKKRGTKEPENKRTMEERKQMFAESLKNFSSQYERSMLLDFYYYWSEESAGNRKLRFEMQKTWNLEGRLRTWGNNESKFSKSSHKPITTKFETLQTEFEKAVTKIANGE